MKTEEPCDMTAREQSIKVLETLSESTRRSEILIADFSGRFAKGWTWAVPREFQTALDINLTQRIVMGKSVSPVWTSGSLFSFAGQDTLYDTPLAYSPTWAESIQHIQKSIHVLSATKADQGYSGHVEARFLEKIDDKLVPLKTYRFTQLEFVRGLIAGF